MTEKHAPAVVSIPVPLRLFAARPVTPGMGKAPVLLATHGYAQRALPMLGLAKRFAPDAFLIVSIQGPQSVYSPDSSVAEPKVGFHYGVSPEVEDNRAVHRAAVAAAIEWAMEHGGDGGRVSLVGFSHSCSLNYRLALAPPHGVALKAVVGICGGLPGEWKEPGTPGTVLSKATHTLHVSTTEDEWYPMEKVAPYKGRLEARFASAEHLVFDGPHRAPSASFDAIREFLGSSG